MSLSLCINIVDSNVRKSIVFSPSTTGHDACRVIREKYTEAQDQPKVYGLCLTDEDNTTRVWLEQARNLEYYILKNGDTIRYRKKLRTLRVKMFDGTKLGVKNHDEYSLVLEDVENQENVENRDRYGTMTLKRRKEERERDAQEETTH